jgi:hypothetical protein
VSHRSRRQGLRAQARWRPAAVFQPGPLRCGVTQAVPGNSARATGDGHERQIACFDGAARLPGLWGRFATGSLLLDRRLRASLSPVTLTGWSLCEEHRRLHDEGYVALVEIDPVRSAVSEKDDTVAPSRAWRTGLVAHLRREVFAQVFSPALAGSQACVFVEPGVIGRMETLSHRHLG